MKKTLYFIAVFCLLFSCREKEEPITPKALGEILDTTEIIDTTIIIQNLDTIDSYSFPFSIIAEDSILYILGRTYVVDGCPPEYYDLTFTKYNLSDGSMLDTTLQFNNDYNYKETPIKLIKDGSSLYLYGKYNHWDDFADMWTYPFLMKTSLDGVKEWETNESMIYPPVLSRDFHLHNNKLYTVVNTVYNDTLNIKTRVYNTNGQSVNTFMQQSTDYNVQTSLIVDDQLIIISKLSTGNADTMKILEMSTEGVVNWESKFHLEHPGSINSAINIGSNIYMTSNSPDNSACHMLSYNISENSLTLLHSSQNNSYFEMIYHNDKIIISKGEKNGDYYDKCYLDVFTNSGTLENTITLDKYTSYKKVAISAYNEGLVAVGDFEEKLIITRLDQDFQVLE